MPTFNILIATTGRKTLSLMLNSLINELLIDDCLTIVFDGNMCNEDNKKILNTFKCKVNIYEEEIPLGFWGHGIRNKYAKILEKRDFVLHADDDDMYVKNIFSFFRQQCLDVNTLYIGRVYFGENQYKLYMPNDTKIIRIGNISTQCGIIPYELNNSGCIWGNFYGGDGDFYVQLTKKSKNIVYFDKNIYIMKEYLATIGLS